MPGLIIEHALVKDLYANPLHPYTLGLLGSLPRVDELEHRRLLSIDGLPPDAVRAAQVGCPFAPRCTFVVDRCLQENPPLLQVAPGHEVACWVDAKTGALR